MTPLQRAASRVARALSNAATPDHEHPGELLSEGIEAGGADVRPGGHQATVTDVSADMSNCGDGPPSFTGCAAWKVSANRRDDGLEACEESNNSSV